MSLPRNALRRLLDVGESLCDEGALDAVDVGRYEIVRELGRGGMGVVFEAIDPELGRRVALKVLSQSAGLGTEARLRFVREAKAAAQLTHPNIAAVYDATPEAIAMQLIDGVTLSEFSDDDPRVLATLVRDAALAVHAAHQQGIVHRDLKPGNLMVELRENRPPHVYVLDFGLAKARDLDASLSTTGGLIGTPHFMSPEQARGMNDAIGATSDVYGLGATLFATLTGRAPFARDDGIDVIEVLRRTVEEEAPNVRQFAPRVAADLATIVAKCLRKEPEARYPSALALASDLDRWLRGEPVQARPISIAYRIRKAILRHQLALNVGIIAFGLAFAVVFPRWQLQRARAESAESAMKLTTRVRTILSDHVAFVRHADREKSRPRLEQGVRECREFLASTETATAHHLLGLLLRALADSKEALVAQERALELSPELLAARFERAILLGIDYRERCVAFSGETLPDDLVALRDRAAADFRAVAGVEFGHPELDLLFGRGLAALLDGDLDLAEQHLRELEQRDPSHVEMHLTLSRIYLLRGDADAAMRSVISAAGHSRQPRAREAPIGEYPRVMALANVDELFFDFGELFRVRPVDSFAFGNRAQLAIRRALASESERADGDPTDASEIVASWRDAQALLSSTLTLAPDFLPALVNRGMCEVRLDLLLSTAGDVEGAREARRNAERDLSRAVDIDPSNAVARFDRGLYLRRRARLAFIAGGDVESFNRRANEDLDLAIEASPEDERERMRIRVRAVRGR